LFQVLSVLAAKPPALSGLSRSDLVLWRDAEVSECAPRFRLLVYTGPTRARVWNVENDLKPTPSTAITAARPTTSVVGGYAITAVHLMLKAKIAGADQATFEKLANKAKAGCPVSKLLNADITLDTSLVT
jgi:hypothetical protein